MKAILIDNFGEDLAFTYPRGKKKSQMFYLSRVQIEDVIETIRAKDTMEMCAEKLRSECQEFYFGFDKSFRYASDLEYEMEKLESTDSLQHWNSFFDIVSHSPFFRGNKKKVQGSFSNRLRSDS